MKKQKTIAVLRLISELVAIALFVFLLLNHKLPFWIALFGISVVLSFALGRFYCSWICPMNTPFRAIDWLYRKLGITRLKAPKFLSNRFVRIGFLVLFVVSMILNIRLSLKLNILLYVAIFSVLLTLLFEEAFWHRHLCPFGTILSISSRKARYALRIEEDACIECGKCQKVCPSTSIVTLENGKRRNFGHECLLCANCIDACPVSVCQFEWN